MPRCPHCRTPMYASREELGARCSYCREPLYERLIDEPREERLAAGKRCAVHADNPAQVTCQRCGNYMCWVCRTRWQGKAWCAACVARSLETSEALPEEARRHLRESVLGLVFGLAAWGVALLGIVVMIAGFNSNKEAANIVLMGFGMIILMASPLLAVLGVGQAAAAIRTRGDHMILATSGLILSGLNAAMVIGLFAMVAWQG
jgi:hypothetical protein